MPARIIWTEDMDWTLVSMRRRGEPWLVIADCVGVCEAAARRRARKGGIATGRLNIGPISGREVAAGAKPPPKPRTRLPDGRRVPGLSPLWQIDETR